MLHLRKSTVIQQGHRRGEGKFEHEDVLGEKMTGDHLIFSGATVVGGKWWHAKVKARFGKAE